MDRNSQRAAYIAWLREERGLSDDEAAARADAPKPRPFETLREPIPERWDNVVRFQRGGRAAAMLLAVAICAGCQPYTFGTVDSGPGGATVLRGEAAAAYRATRSGCARAGFWTVDRRAAWADCMREAGYTVTLARD